MYLPLLWVTDTGKISCISLISKLKQTKLIKNAQNVSMGEATQHGIKVSSAILGQPRLGHMIELCFSRSKNWDKYQETQFRFPCSTLRVILLLLWKLLYVMLSDILEKVTRLDLPLETAFSLKLLILDVHFLLFLFKFS